MGEQMLRWYGESRRPAVVSLRYFNASGASADALIGEDIRLTLNLVPLVMKATLGLRPPIQVFGTDFPTPDGTAIRDYIHVDDLASGHLLALSTSSGGGRRAINLGTGEGSSVRQVIDAAERVSGRPYRPSTWPAGPVIRARCGPTTTWPRGARVEAVLRARRDHRVGVALALHPPQRLFVGRPHRRN